MIANGLSDNEAFARLRLIRSQNIGPVTFRQLLGRFGSAIKAIDALPDIAARGKGRKVTLADPKKIENEITQSHNMGAQLIFLGSDEYPLLLAQMESAPACLIVRGNKELIKKPMVAIVGARNASAAACRFARTLSYDLKERGFTVVSGLARGIDTAVHMGAGGGGTAAVIAGGINIAYPPENSDLQNKLADNDIVLTEETYDTKPIARHFPNRNRIIAGLSMGTVVVEAAPRSGSLITARLSGELGREVMAIPGSPLDPRSRGCNQLIRDGANLVQSADDIAELLTSFNGLVSEGKWQSLEEVQEDWEEDSNTEPKEDEREDIISLLGMTFVSMDELIRQTSLSAANVQMILLELELAGRLERGAGAKVRMLN